MPITPAHAAAAWPIHRAFSRLPLAALVIGTMAPDLEYVLRMRPEGRFGHTPIGVFAFCLPTTLILWAVWRAFVRPALTPLLPPAIRAAAEAPPPGRASDALPLATVAALLGAATHILWDGFTHETGWAVTIFPQLRRIPFAIMPAQSWVILAQLFSTVAGLLIVAVWTAREWRRWPAHTRRFEPGQRARVARMALFVTAFSLTMGAVNALFASSWIQQLGRGIVGTMAGVGIGLVV